MTVRSKLPTLLLILSLGLNLAFVGTWLVSAIAARQPAVPGAVGGEPGKTIWCPLHREIGVDLRQWEQIEPRLLRFQAETADMRREIRSLRRQMMNLLASPREETMLIQEKQVEILSAQRAMQTRVIQHLLAEKEFLAPDQQKKFFELIGSQMQGGGGAPLAGARDQGCLP
jgi:hypothetical protein